MAAGALETLREMMGTRRSERHVACACSFQLTMCGRWTPGATGVEKASDPESLDWCQPCLEVWNATGCGRCGCSGRAPCVDCVQACTD